jgi:hypothetical protein
MVLPSLLSMRVIGACAEAIAQGFLDCRLRCLPAGLGEVVALRGETEGIFEVGGPSAGSDSHKGEGFWPGCPKVRYPGS